METRQELMEDVWRLMENMENLQIS